MKSETTLAWEDMEYLWEKEQWSTCVEHNPNSKRHCYSLKGVVEGYTSRAFNNIWYWCFKINGTVSENRKKRPF